MRILRKMLIGWAALLLGLLLVAGGRLWAAPTADCTSGNFFGTYETSDVTLGGELFVTSNVLVRDGITLTIEPGATVTFCGEYQIRVEGSANLVAAGTASEPILFKADNPAVKWRAIQFVGEIGENSILRYVTLQDGGAASSVDNAALYINPLNVTDLPSPVVDRVTILNSGNYGLNVHTESEDPTPPQITHITIENSALAAMRADAESLGGVGPAVSFSGNGSDTIQVANTSRVYVSQTWRNPGVPIEIMVDVIVALENFVDPAEGPVVLTLEPGLTFLMHPDVWFSIGSSSGRRGVLHAEGTAAEPITFTRASSTSAPWDALWLQQYPDTVSRLKHVVLEYGGSTRGGTIYGVGPAVLDNVTVRASASDGLNLRGRTVTIRDSAFEANQGYGLYFFNGNDGSIVRGTTIVNNVAGGLFNNDDNDSCIDAIGNFWGAGNGPADNSGAADACGAGSSNAGSGSSVSDGVRYAPWLPGIAELQNRGTLLPDAFYVVADGLDNAVIEVTLRDAQGNPLVGREVVLETTVGTLTQPSTPTDELGRTTAVISSTVSGYAYLTAHNLTDDTPVAGIAGVTFWQGAGDFGGLISPSGAPFANPELILEGKPFQQGSPVGMRLPLQNSNPNPVEVQVVYGVTGLSIGARFTPVYTATRTLQPGEAWDASGVWLPDVTGHRCIQAALTINPADLAGDVAGPQQINVLNFLQKNTDQNPCDPDALNPQQALPRKPGGLSTVASTFWKLYNLSKKANRCLETNLTFDVFDRTASPRDYEVIVTPPVYDPPAFAAGPDLSAAEAAALNDLAGTAAELLALNQAIGATSQRMNWASQAARGGAASSGDVRALSSVNPLAVLDRQFAAYRDYINRYAAALERYADQIEALQGVIAGTAAADLLFEPADYADTRSELATTGFDAETTLFYEASGLPTPLIEELTADLVADYDGRPATAATLSEILSAAAAETRALAAELGGRYPAADLRQAAAGATVFVEPVVFTFEVGHPLETSKTVELQVKPVSLPVNWTYELSDSSVTVEAGVTRQVSLTLLPGGEMIEDSLVQVAVEGIVDGELVGGILLEHITPRLDPRPPYQLYLPLIER